MLFDLQPAACGGVRQPAHRLAAECSHCRPHHRLTHLRHWCPCTAVCAVGLPAAHTWGGSSRSRCSEQGPAEAGSGKRRRCPTAAGAAELRWCNCQGLGRRRGGRSHCWCTALSDCCADYRDTSTSYSCSACRCLPDTLSFWRPPALQCEHLAAHEFAGGLPRLVDTLQHAVQHCSSAFTAGIASPDSSGKGAASAGTCTAYLSDRLSRRIVTPVLIRRQYRCFPCV